MKINSIECALYICHIYTFFYSLEKRNFFFIQTTILKRLMKKYSMKRGKKFFSFNENCLFLINTLIQQSNIFILTRKKVQKKFFILTLIEKKLKIRFESFLFFLTTSINSFSTLVRHWRKLFKFSYLL